MLAFDFQHFPECHLTWLDDILSGIVAKPGDKCNYIKSLYKKYKLKENSVTVAYGVDNYDDLNNFNEQNPTYPGLFARKLNEAAKDVYVGEKTAAMKILELLKTSMAKLTGEHERLKYVMTYLVESLEWACQVISSNFSGNIAEQQSKLLTTWENLQNSKINQAVILYMQASLFVDCKGSDADSLYYAMLQVVICLDSEYLLWYHYAHLRLRNKRLNQSVLLPTATEVFMSIKAFELDQEPKTQMSLFHYGLLLNDFLGDRSPCLVATINGLLNRNFENREQIFEESLRLFREAEKLAEQNKLIKWVLKIRVHIAELMYYCSTDSETNLKGVNILLDSLNDYPSNAVLHCKLGKMFMRGISSSRGWREKIDSARTAKYYFKTGLLLKQYNYFDCIKYYMKVFALLSPPLPLDEALELLEESLQLAKAMSYIQSEVWIRMWKGCVLWISGESGEERSANKKRAVKEWVLCLGTKPDIKESLIETITKEPYNVSKCELQKTLDILLATEANLNQATLETIDMMTNLTIGSGSKESYRSYKSIADQDDNWRAGK